MDPPGVIVGTAVELHRKMIREYAGAPGVSTERMQEGMQVRHCALSLVGEPIMYPEINALVDELHSRRISTFLVTNAQFPDRIAQLYVSVDAATPDSLKAVDRPLFSDFWQRFLDSLTALRTKQQRTVYRLTLVRGMNMAEVAAYAKLVDLGQPDFIEVKGVTYCGNSAGGLNMADNVPFHEEVVDFCQALCTARNGQPPDLPASRFHPE
ncbi:flavodoxin-like domain-containing protein [Haematococcus lacustris]|uniref:Flavodoxin-like domain-containing protein n=1 Tax=Haematococcus lacustris TaxID=44745 RepID=A0A699ZPF8_HAELA|nr:flavodoxin-like domain-containing protein [Haematococcus lacustris]